ncbi:type II toxin-antitoxin system VapC family toxin [Paraburkholderia unamae]|uniref:PIN domain nuclease of toxin-antitoxin system n=1 Tax=Paraburkholderia unamae TaxID=219649 RepID=A0ABX5KH26_9BURK|nr:type II toxin-antitoxin system VapC family toxin [Paraburkholderia unamae]PVX78981.1 PIN domain nuclease of toxin-antitoxin system [Paraburkholderia unamae]CAG9258076.1 Twitching motility protein PilT [Paraburkholderia unamae]
MNILLDTHIALWAIADSPRLPKVAREMILAPTSTIYVSTASIWEIGIKYSLHRGDMPVSGEAALHYFRQAGYRILPIEAEHAVAVESLPPHHQDPFDRLLVAQALTEPLRLISHDRQVAQYSDTVVLV